MTGKRLLPDDKVGEFVKDMLENKFFFSTQIHEKQLDLLHLVFMPLAFMTEEQREQLIKDEVAVFYGPYSSSFPRSINGYPFLGEVGFLTNADWAIVIEKYNKAKEAMDAVLGTAPKEKKPKKQKNG